jgi:hypothetical protein
MDERIAERYQVLEELGRELSRRIGLIMHATGLRDDHDEED